jgi:CBS domain containing-hemolysin-like protein
MVSLLFLFAFVAILVSFLCSLWEAVLLSITPSYAQIELHKESRIGIHLEEFKSNIDRPLSALLTLNTIAHTVGAIMVGAQATLIWEETHPFITAIVVPFVMTLAILILSEIIPKTIGANYWRELAPFTVSSLRGAIKCLLPLVWLSQSITKSLKKDKARSIFSRSDFLAMAEIGVKEGLFEQSESEILRNLLRFNTIQAKDVMTPRTVVKVAGEEESIREFYDANKDLRFSRIPVYQGDLHDHIIGYILKDEMLGEIVQGHGDEPIGKIKREILVIPASFQIPELFNRFIDRREHIALVVDEFGGMAGIVTMEDVIETLLGMEIVDEYDSDVDMQMLARKNWERRARLLGLIETQPPDTPKAAEEND